MGFPMPMQPVYACVCKAYTGWSYSPTTFENLIIYKLCKNKDAGFTEMLRNILDLCLHICLNVIILIFLTNRWRYSSRNSFAIVPIQ